MRSYCNKSIRVARLEDTIYDIKARMMIWQFVSILISPVICLLGTIGNVLVVVVTSKKTNEKSLKENQYLYMKLKSIANCLILLIQIFSLLSDCQSKYTGIYCSRTLLAYSTLRSCLMSFSATISAFWRTYSTWRSPLTGYLSSVKRIRNSPNFYPK